MVEDKDKTSGDEFDDLTPEEKLFRAVVSDSGDIDDFMDEDDDYQQESMAGLKNAFNSFVGAVSALFAKLGKGSYSSAKSAPAATAEAPAQPEWMRKIAHKVKLKYLNRSVGIIVILMLVYLFIDIFFGNSQSFKSMLGNTKGQEVSLLPDHSPEPAKPLDYYLNPTQGRNVFRKVEPPEPPPVVEKGEPPVVVQEVPVNLRLAGISWDDTEYVAMVEVAEEGRARFVRKGDKLPGEIEVMEVSEAVVSLKKNTQEWDLV